MKSRTTIFTLLALAAVLVLFWSIHWKPQHQMLPSPQETPAMPNKTGTATVAEVETGTKPVPPNAPTLNELVERGDLEGVRARIENAPMTQLWKTPITFHGRVIDQNTNPVPDAKIHFAWTDLSPNGTSETNTQSDVNGLFALSGVTGRGLSVYVSKPGYYLSKRSPTSFDYGDGYQPDGNPVEFILRKQGLGVDLITSRYGVTPNFPVSAQRDGTPVLVDLLHRSISPAGQLEIKQVKPVYEQWKEASEWSVRMEISSGGFIEHHDEFPFEAPHAGYQRAIEFRFRKGETNWSEDLVKDYYVVFGNPATYGRVHLETSILSGGVRLAYAINPDGSRNLEPRPPAPPPRRQLPPGGVEIGPGDPVPR